MIRCTIYAPKSWQSQLNLPHRTEQKIVMKRTKTKNWDAQKKQSSRGAVESVVALSLLIVQWFQTLNLFSPMHPFHSFLFPTLSDSKDAAYTNNWKRLSVPRSARKLLSSTLWAASQASTDSAWRHPMWLPHSSLSFQHPVGRRSYFDSHVQHYSDWRHNRAKCSYGLF